MALCKNQGKRQSGKEQIQEDVREYLLLGLYAGTALRFPTPRTHLLVLVWMEKAHPLCAAHVVPVQKSPRVEILILRKKNNNRLTTKMMTCLFAQTTEQNLLEPLNV